MAVYPIIKYPKVLANISTTFPERPDEPPYPKEPRPPSPIPEFYKLDDLESELNKNRTKRILKTKGILYWVYPGVSYMVLILGILIAAFHFDKKWVLLAFPIWALAILNEYFKERNRKKANLDYLNSEYRTAIRMNDLFTKQYELRMFFYELSKKTYLADLEEYDERISQYKEELEELEAPEYIEEYRNELFKKFYTQIAKPEKSEKSQYRVTLSRFLAERLNLHIGNAEGYPSQIQTDGCLIIDKGDFKAYYPDIILHHYPIVIDIEIDEPYVDSTGEPIHFLGYNDIIEKILLEKYWCIIRFTEKQVVHYPDICCFKVIQFIYEMTRNEFYLSLIKDKFPLPEEPQWSKEEAYQMAYKRTRNNYLPQELLAKLSE
jgi:hypothetical protein